METLSCNIKLENTPIKIGFIKIKIVAFAREIFFIEVVAAILAKNPKTPLKTQGVLAYLGIENRSYFESFSK